MKFIVRWLVTAIAAGAAVVLVPGISAVGGTDSIMPIVVFALVLSLVNIAIKPIVQFLSLPLTCLTLGLFYLVINALMLELAAWASAGLFGTGVNITGFGSAVLGSIVISIVSGLVNGLIGRDDDGGKRR